MKLEGGLPIVLIFGSLMILLLIFGTLYKYWEVRKANRWLSVPGKIVSSRSKARRMKKAQGMIGAEAGADQDMVNFADIVYEYRVKGKTYKGSRVSIGEDLGDHDVEHTIARYPAGSKVTVYYNPDKPGQAVLETGAPEGVWRTMAIFISVLIVLLVGGTFGFTKLVNILRDNLSNPERAIPVAALAGLAAIIGLIALALKRQVEAAQSWSTVDGVIETAQIESFREHTGLPNRSRKRFFKADIVYGYRVGKVDYKGSRLRFGGRFYATFSLFARNQVENYPPGTKVTVYYNPENASEAVLEPLADGFWTTVLLATLLATGAAALALS
jgi:hypothetical protein